MVDAEARLLYVERVLADIILAWRANGQIPPFKIQALHGFLANGRQNFDPLERVSDPLLMTYREVARELGVSLRTISRLVASGRLRVVGRGVGTRVHRDDLTDYVEELRRPTSRGRELTPRRENGNEQSGQRTTLSSTTVHEITTAEVSTSSPRRWPRERPT
jgi:excisionase family DNA binding protein